MHKFNTQFNIQISTKSRNSEAYIGLKTARMPQTYKNCFGRYVVLLICMLRSVCIFTISAILNVSSFCFYLILCSSAKTTQSINIKILFAIYICFVHFEQTNEDIVVVADGLKLNTCTISLIL